MRGVTLNVQGCYAAAAADWERIQHYPVHYRFCVFYDAAASLFDAARARTFGVPRTGYFEPGATEQRLREHIILVGRDPQADWDELVVQEAPKVGPFLPLRFIGPGRQA